MTLEDHETQPHWNWKTTTNTTYRHYHGIKNDEQGSHHRTRRERYSSSSSSRSASSNPVPFRQVMHNAPRRRIIKRSYSDALRARSNS